ncbi:UNVERIFIED_CONTAM: hypothetical protein Sangu_3024900 [Sesamum angustifolium]|uniref:Reverse transcriptase n=1 Tax=Sesamum angustifolium TaxID=2727405 RepID=A0AAW2KMX0_9LAMI
MNLKRDISKVCDWMEWLFLLRVLELLSSFRVAVKRGTIPSVEVCRGAPLISHLLFVDATKVCCPIIVVTVKHVQQVLDTYKLAFGQEINLHKSSVAFTPNTPLETRQHLVEILGVHFENKHEVYLRLPMVAFRSKMVIFAALKDRVWRGFRSGMKNYYPR